MLFFNSLHMYLFIEVCVLIINGFKLHTCVYPYRHSFLNFISGKSITEIIVNLNLMFYIGFDLVFKPYNIIQTQH